MAGSHVLSITNSGTGNSFVLNDEAGDVTPFAVDASGKVAIGGAITAGIWNGTDVDISTSVTQRTSGL